MRKQITKTWEEVRRTARRVLPLMLMVASCALICSGKAYAANPDTWGPRDRATFTWDSPADYRVMNSITNNPQIGDERNFVRIREYGSTANYDDRVTAEAGKVYEVYVYFHNNASASLNANGSGIADNVHLAVEYPERISAGQAAMVKGTIWAGNTNPESVWDTAYIYAPDGEPIYLRYVPNTAVIHSFGSIDGSILSDSALYSSRGVMLGYSVEHWGILPGCNEYAGYVTFRIQADQPGFTMDKTAAVNNSGSYAEEVTVRPGDSIKYKIHFKNTGTTIQDDVVVYDNLPPRVSLVSGSVFLETPAGSGFIGDDLFSRGQTIGDFYGGQEAWITYEVQVGAEAQFICGETDIFNNSAVVTDNGTKTDKVKATVVRQCDTPEDEPEDEPEETPDLTPDEPVERPDTPQEEVVERPSTPERPQRPSNNVEQPNRLPVTGPGEIVVAIVAIVAVGVGTTYYIVSRRELKKLEGKTKK